ncbi:MAG: thioester reductase domain-containing protein, partial [Gammaproteobacteria bacterium]
MSGSSVESREILLTGATGFLGAYLLSELLQDKTSRVHCLVRAPHAAAGRERIEKSLRHYHLWQERWAQRIEVIAGDLEKPMIGMSKDQYVRLSETVAAIYHNGAVVNYVLPYSKLQKANVQGTQEIIRLAAKGKVPVYYVSTLRLFDSRVDGHPISELDAVDETKTMYSGYSQSKWISEKLCKAAGARGIPYAIFRPGLVCGDGIAGIANENDAVSRFIKGCVELGCAPDSELQLNLTPVDFVIKALVWLSRRAESNGAVFHLINDTATLCNRVFEKLVDVGYPLKMVPYLEWVRRLREAAESENAKDLVPLLQYFDEHLPAKSQQRIFDSSYTRERLKLSGIRCRD